MLSKLVSINICTFVTLAESNPSWRLQNLLEHLNYRGANNDPIQIT